MTVFQDDRRHGVHLVLLRGEPLPLHREAQRRLHERREDDRHRHARREPVLRGRPVSRTSSPTARRAPRSRARTSRSSRSAACLEAPALFVHDGKYHVVASGATGWAPEPADLLHGRLDARHVDPRRRRPATRTRTSPTTRSPRAATACCRSATSAGRASARSPRTSSSSAPGKFVYMGDRWNEGKSDSTYVWLPITIGEGGRLEMRNPAARGPGALGRRLGRVLLGRQGLRRGDLDASTDDRLPDTVARGADASALLPEHRLGRRRRRQPRTTAVTWSARRSRASRARRRSPARSPPTPSSRPGARSTRTIEVTQDGSPTSRRRRVTASSRADLAGTRRRRQRQGQGLGRLDRRPATRATAGSTFDWSARRSPLDSIVVHTYKDGAARHLALDDRRCSTRTPRAPGSTRT